MPPSPQPMPYHRAMVEHLKNTEPALWDWFTASRQTATDADSIRLDLLKTTYRIDVEANPHLHELAKEVQARMKLDCHISLYQSQLGDELNAALVYLPDEAHIVFSGSLTTVLTDDELRAVIAHELAHYTLFTVSAGEFLIVADLVQALTHDPNCSLVATESYRRLNLWTELYADRWACHICDDVGTTVATLLKTSTGLVDVHPESYLKQAEEIFAKGTDATTQLTHPESYIRARALRLWVEQGETADPELKRMIAGGLNLNRLDFLDQVRISQLTRWFLQTLLAPPWFQTDGTLAHARRFFPDFAVGSSLPDLGVLKAEIADCDPSLINYLGYLLLDFATVDRDLGEPAIAAAIMHSRRLRFDPQFTELAQKELGLGKKAFAKISRDAEAILANIRGAIKP